MPWVDKSKCTGCGRCVEECPVDTIAMEDDFYLLEIKNRKGLIVLI
ncbi:MAG: 4Fe-4S binding protein [Candidatus Omnitrophica bacterium]|nr:4Fe-4S binding protein [Candidatus Omnitrophota bacterium]